MDKRLLRKKALPKTSGGSSACDKDDYNSEECDPTGKWAIICFTVLGVCVLFLCVYYGYKCYRKGKDGPINEQCIPSLEEALHSSNIEKVVVLRKVEGWETMTAGKLDTFFYQGYPTQTLFRDRFSEEEWKRFDQEFVYAWNRCTMSRIPQALKCLAFFPGFLLLFLPTIWISVLVADNRSCDILKVVAKANKYILRPRGMFMKEQVIIESASDPGSETAWYEIAVTPDTISRLEAKRYCFVVKDDDLGYGEKKYRKAAEGGREDSDFEHRWPVPPREYSCSA